MNIEGKQKFLQGIKKKCRKAKKYLKESTNFWKEVKQNAGNQKNISTKAKIFEGKKKKKKYIWMKAIKNIWRKAKNIWWKAIKNIWMNIEVNQKILQESKKIFEGKQKYLN